jgi:hypothetical protein
MKTLREYKEFLIGIIGLSLSSSILSALKDNTFPFALEVILSFILVLFASFLIGGTLWGLIGFVNKKFEFKLLIKIVATINFIITFVYLLEFLR